VRIALFDPFSGASGDMILGALMDAGLDPNALRDGLADLPLDPWELRVERIEQHGIGGIRATVVAAEGEHARDWATIRDMIAASNLPAAVRQRALSVFAALADAEAGIHGVPVERIHFHEVGGVDAVVDICGACLGLSVLGVERVFSAPARAGAGWVRAAHGPLPVPAPATAALLTRAGAPLAAEPNDGDSPGELLTPTGAALLTTLAEFRRPAFAPIAVGYGFGTRTLPWPNALRVWLGDLDDAATPSFGPIGVVPLPMDASGNIMPIPAEPAELLLETNIDDMNPQFTEPLMEQLFAAGALDAWLTPVQMKKGRPGVVVSVLCAGSDRRTLEDILFEHTTTLGVRCQPVDRTKAARRFESVTTRWGEVRLKLRGWKGRVIDVGPEFEDCAALARSADVPVREVWNEAHRMGEVYVGQRWQPDRPPGLRVVPPMEPDNGGR
jgi:hypothetical protein